MPCWLNMLTSTDSAEARLLFGFAEHLDMVCMFYIYIYKRFDIEISLGSGGFFKEKSNLVVIFALSKKITK